MLRGLTPAARLLASLYAFRFSSIAPREHKLRAEAHLDAAIEHPLAFARAFALLKHKGFLAVTVAALPIAIWEFSLGVWLIVKGFRPSPITAGWSSGAAD